MVRRRRRRAVLLRLQRQAGLEDRRRQDRQRRNGARGFAGAFRKRGHLAVRRGRRQKLLHRRIGQEDRKRSLEDFAQSSGELVNAAGRSSGEARGIDHKRQRADHFLRPEDRQRTVDGERPWQQRHCDAARGPRNGLRLRGLPGQKDDGHQTRRFGRRHKLERRLAVRQGDGLRAFFDTLRRLHLSDVRPRHFDLPRRQDRQGGLRRRPHSHARHIHRFAGGLRRQAIVDERRRRHIRHQGRAEARSACDQLGRRAGLRVTRDLGRNDFHSRREKSLLRQRQSAGAGEVSMKLKTFLACLALLLSATVSGFAGDKADLSGTWTLDKDKSFSNGPEFDQTMTITHSGEKVKLDAKQKTPRGEVTINEEYTLDGKEAEFTPQNPPNAKGKRKATWLANGRGILVEDEIVDGQSTRRVSRKMTLSSDGKILTVDYFIDDSRGSFELKRVFNKVG